MKNRETSISTRLKQPTRKTTPHPGWQRGVLGSTPVWGRSSKSCTLVKVGWVASKAVGGRGYQIHWFPLIRPATNRHCFLGRGLRGPGRVD